MISDLVTASPEFAQWWPRHAIGAFESHRRVFQHPEAGRLEFVTQQLIPAGDLGLRIVVHLSIENDDSTARLAARSTSLS